MDGITVYHFRNLSNHLAHKNLSIAPTMGFAHRKHIESFDLIHIREYFSVQTALAHHYATKKVFLTFCKLTVRSRGSPGRNLKAALQNKNYPKKIFDLLVGHSMLKDASKIIATSRVESDQFTDVFPDFPLDKVIHLPNCVDFERYEDLPARGQFRRKHKIDEDAKIVLFLSAYTREKADLLVAAFSRLKRAVDFPVKLVIAGPDEGYSQNLHSMAKELKVAEDTVFTGALYEPEKPWAYVDADVFVLPSKDRYE